MPYRVNEIFYSLQGEGHNTGRAAVFVRFAGCNLKCPFCDTEFTRYEELTTEEILAQIANVYHPTPNTQHPSSLLVILTGGEPTLQVDRTGHDALQEVRCAQRSGDGQGQGEEQGPRTQIQGTGQGRRRSH